MWDERTRLWALPTKFRTFRSGRSPQNARTLVRGPARCDNRALQKGPALTCHGRRRDRERGAAYERDAVAEQLRAGEPFGEVEDSIDQVAELTIDEKAALWLFAFSLRDPAEQQLDARAHLASLQ